MLVGIIRDAPWAQRARVDYGLDHEDTISVTSAICLGEIMALAEKRSWGRRKRHQLDNVLADLPAIGIDAKPILNAYARIDAWTHGKSVDAPEFASPPKPAVKMKHKQNDMWIAATAYAMEAVLLSTDNDFRHLRSIGLRYVYVEPR